MNKSNSKPPHGLATIAVHAGETPNTLPGGTGDVIVPLHLSTTFAREKLDVPTGGYEYSRSGNPTRHTLEARLAQLEGAAGALAFSSGLAATTTVMLALLGSGSKVVAGMDLYGGVRRLLHSVLSERWNLNVVHGDLRGANPDLSAIDSDTAVVWIESPSNPLLEITDIQRVADAAHEANPDCIVVVDSTFATPVFQQPLSLGADIVMHSTTKYIGGHSDTVGGALCVKNPEILKRLQFVQNSAGPIISPFDAFLTLRGIRTLSARMVVHARNAMAVACYLERHERVETVVYPGLASHPDHDIATKQMSGFSGMITVKLKGDVATATQFVQSLKLFALAESLGGVESLIEIPAAMTHASVPLSDRDARGIDERLIRISVGIEDATDLLNDIEQAIEGLPSA